MDYEEKKRRQMIRVVITEVGMVIAVAAIVVISVMAAMGFFISGDGKIEQSGLMQIHSMPTGATVELDGVTLFSRTNLSRTMAAGRHTVRLSRTGYDTWENTLPMQSGMLSRLYYPRLFLQNRAIEEVLALDEPKQVEDKPKGFEFYQPATSGNYILYMVKNSPEWHLVDVRGDTVNQTVLDLSGVLPGMEEDNDKAENQASERLRLSAGAPGGTPEYRFAGRIESVKWSTNDEKVLVRVRYQDEVNWVLVNLRNLAESRNLTKDFNLDFARLEMIDVSGNYLYSYEHEQIRKIDVGSGSISRVLIDKVMDFTVLQGHILFLAKNEVVSGTESAQIGVYRDGDEGATILAAVPSQAVKLGFSKYLDDYYFAYTVNTKLNVFYGALPTYDADSSDLAINQLKTAVKRELEFVPDKMMLSSSGGFLVLTSGEQVISYSFDNNEYRNYEAPGGEIRWFQDGMLHTVKDGKIVVWDYDGANLRDMAESVGGEPSKVTAKEVLVPANGRYMYYLSHNGRGVSILTREKLRD